jgi:hypothetical protein
MTSELTVQASRFSVGKVQMFAVVYSESFSTSRDLRGALVLKDGDGLAQVAGLGRAAA